MGRSVDRRSAAFYEIVFFWFSSQHILFLHVFYLKCPSRQNPAPLVCGVPARPRVGVCRFVRFRRRRLHPPREWSGDGGVAGYLFTGLRRSSNTGVFIFRFSEMIKYRGICLSVTGVFVLSITGDDQIPGYFLGSIVVEGPPLTFLLLFFFYSISK